MWVVLHLKKEKNVVVKSAFSPLSLFKFASILLLSEYSSGIHEMMESFEIFYQQCMDQSNVPYLGPFVLVNNITRGYNIHLIIRDLLSKTTQLLDSSSMLIAKLMRVMIEMCSLFAFVSNINVDGYHTIRFKLNRSENASIIIWFMSLSYGELNSTYYKQGFPLKYSNEIHFTMHDDLIWF